MAFNGSGVFLRVMNWVADAQADIDIRADRHDVQDDDYAAGLSNCITRDGQSQPTNNLPMNGKKLVNLGAPTDPNDAATKAYADQPKPYTGGVIISGADTNGMVNFTSLTGANGLSFVGADLSWIARLATAAGPGTPPVPPATLNRLVLNDKPDGSGADVATINDDGSASFGVLKATSITTGVVTANPTVAIKPTSGNGNVWWYGTDGVADRMVIYTSADAQGSGYLRIGGTQTFEFNTSGQFKSPGAHFAGAALLNTDGNISGSIWDNLGYHDAYTAIVNRIESRASAYAANKVGVTQMQRVSLVYSGNVPGGGGAWVSPGGTVIVGYNRTDGVNGQVYGLYYMTLQIYDDKNGWRNMGG